jgi:DNA-binding phage protein
MGFQGRVFMSDLLTPIAGVSLEKYAELVVKMRGVLRDANACAAIAEVHGVSRAAWDRAMQGWEARLTSDATPAALLATYYDFYRDALALHARSQMIANFNIARVRR